MKFCLLLVVFTWVVRVGQGPQSARDVLFLLLLCLATKYPGGGEGMGLDLVYLVQRCLW